MRELVFKRQNELEEIYRVVHMDVDSGAARQILNDLIDSGFFSLSFLMHQIYMNTLFVLVYSLGALS